MPASVGRREIRPASSSPSMPGMHRSSRASAYGVSVAAASSRRARAETPSSATSGCMPQAVSCSLRMRRFVWLSSTMSARSPASPTVERAGAADVSTAATWSGSVNQKVLPRPSSLSTPSSPPMAVTSCWQIARPRPVPPNRRVVDESAWENGSNRRFRSVFSRPTPVSVTSNRTTGPSAVSPSRWARTTTSPVSVNFTAFEARFSSTCRSRDGSPRRLSGSSGEQ